MRKISFFKISLLFFLVLLLSGSVESQVCLTKTRTDLSGFATWTDNNLSGTTYLIMLQSASSTITPSFNFNTYTSVKLNFDAKTYGTITGNCAQITISINTGSGYSIVTTRTPVNSTMNPMTEVDLSSYSGNSVYIKFQTSSADGSHGAGIDNIKITGNYNGNSVSITELFLPQFIEGCASSGVNRVPYISLLQINNLNPNSTYRFYNTAVLSTDPTNSDGAGVDLFINTSGDFSRTTTLGMSTAGQYSTINTDVNGSYTGWFILEPTSNTRFTAMNNIFLRITLNDGFDGSSAVLWVTTTNSAIVISFGTTSDKGTGIRSPSGSGALAKNFILLYDNTDGTGRPISGALVENDGVTPISYVTFYMNSVDGISGAWGTIIPNTLPYGIKRIEERSLYAAPTGDSPGDLININTSTTGIWGTVNTVNPNTGTSELVLPAGLLPVELASFTSSISERNINLNWITANEHNNSGFEIQRQKLILGTQFSDWEKVTFVNGNGNKSTPTNYNFEDKKLNTGKYNYRLKQIDYNGNFEYFKLSSLIEIGVPKKFALSQNYPNPFNPVTKIDVDLPFDSKIMIKVYDISGREIKTLMNETKQAGYYTVDFNGSSMASGLYFYRIIAEGNGQKYIVTKKMVLIK